MNKKLFLIAGAVITSAGIYSASVMAATASGSSTATVIAPIGITAGTTLAFGDIISGAAGSVALDTADGVTDTNVVSSGTQTSGTFDITGETGKLYTIAFGAASITLTGLVPANTMTVNGFVHDSGVNGDRTIDAGGVDTLSVGATVNLILNQAPDTYSGSYDVTVDYQ